jgi:uncharacterized delta-60 repeat protein
MLASALLALGAQVALAAPGDLDPSFAGGKGVLVPDFGAQESGNALAIQPDGKILVAGTSFKAPDPGDVLVARFLASGTLDTSFASGAGFARPTLDGAQTAYGLALQPDGKIVLGGDTLPTGAPRKVFLAVRLLNPLGTFDASFGQGGAAAADFGTAETGYFTAVQPDGNILVGGQVDDPVAGGYDPAVARLLNPSGNIDTAGFGGGEAIPDAPVRTSGNAMALQPDGKILIAGGGGGNFVVGRMNPDGSSDDAFGGANTGTATVDFGNDDGAQAIALQPDGKIVVAGNTYIGTGATENDDMAVARLLPNGSPDPSFGTNGRMTIDLTKFDFVGGVAIQRDGKIVVAGDASPGGPDNIAAVRVQPGGTLDTTFGKGGKVTIDIGVNALATSIAIQSDGKAVLAGNVNGTGATGQNMFVARLQGDPGGGPGTGPGGGGGAAPRCGHKKATIVGTNGKDKLTGTKRADVIVALGGNDTIKGGGGNDIICAGSGNDKVSGGSGNDKLYGENGKDGLTGGDGNDGLSGGAGNDKLSGQNGKDSLSGGDGKDSLSGGNGKDSLKGGAGNDKLKGGAGKDRLSGGPGKDKDHQ